MSNTGTNIAIIERNMPMERITPLVEALDMNKNRFMSTVLLACERTPKLFDFPVAQHVQWASTAAALGLEPDGVTGQAYPIPFGNKVQLIVGYKGFNTMAARAGITINSGVILEGDEWDRVLKPGKPFAIQPCFGGRADQNLLGVWAQAQFDNENGSYTMPLVMDLSEILAVKAKAPGGRKKDSPWNDPRVGFPAMAQKTAVRRLQRTLPALITRGRTWSTHHTGAQMDMLHEEASHATHVDLDGKLHDDGRTIDATVNTQIMDILPEIELPNGTMFNFGSWHAHSTVCNKLEITAPQVCEKIHELNKARFQQWIDLNEDARKAAVAIAATLITRYKTGETEDA